MKADERIGIREKLRSILVKIKRPVMLFIFTFYEYDYKEMKDLIQTQNE